MRMLINGFVVVLALLVISLAISIVVYKRNDRRGGDYFKWKLARELIFWSIYGFVWISVYLIVTFLYTTFWMP